MNKVNLWWWKQQCVVVTSTFIVLFTTDKLNRSQREAV